MTILHLCNKVPFPGRDGSSIAMESLIRLEVMAGHKVHVLALNTEKHWVSHPTTTLTQVELECIPVRTAPRLRTALANLASTQSYYASRFYDLNAARQIEARSREADLVVLDSLFMAVYLDAVGARPVVLRAHNVEHAIWLRGLRDEPWYRRPYVALQARRLARWERHVATRVNQIWSISPEDAAWFAPHCRGTVVALPCSADLNSGSWTFSGAHASTAYHLGALDWSPNVRGMHWFLHEISPLLRRAEVHVYSRQWPFPAPSGRVTYHTQGLHDFSQHGIFVAPIRSGSGMRIKLLEAMVRGKAIVTTPLGAEGLGATNGLHLRLAEDAASFAAALDELSANQPMREAMGRAAAAHAARFFSDEVVGAVLREELSNFVR